MGWIFLAGSLLLLVLVLLSLFALLFLLVLVVLIIIRVSIFACLVSTGLILHALDLVLVIRLPRGVKSHLCHILFLRLFSLRILLDFLYRR